MIIFSRRVAERARALVLCGLVAAVAATAAEARNYSILHSFHGRDGSQPVAAVVADKSGNFYGTTLLGGDLNLCGNRGCGTVFKIDSAGSQSLLHVFTGKTHGDGAAPQSALVLDKEGNLYGTTYIGGEHNVGTVFKLAPDGTETIIYSFAPKHGDGDLPTAGLLRHRDGSLYGTTAQGGIANCNSRGCGTVFKIAPDGTESLLYDFTGGSDGAMPGPGTLVEDDAGNFYGTTEYGGNLGCSVGSCGVAYKLTPRGDETVLHAFSGGSDGEHPVGGLAIDAAGNLYGTTELGGGSDACSGGCGTLFKIAADGTYSVLHVFAGGDDGFFPLAAPLADRRGNLYGTTYFGGNAGGGGTVFKFTPDGSKMILHAFFGDRPAAPLISVQGTLYGTTNFGGHAMCNCGAVFQLQ